MLADDGVASGSQISGLDIGHGLTHPVRTVYVSPTITARTVYGVNPPRSVTTTMAVKASPAPPLHRERVIDAALALVDEHGVDALSIRRLAGELGVGAMTIYNHVPSKAALLDGVCERVLAAIDLDADAPGSWEDRIRSYATAWRTVALAHPGAFPLLLTRQLASTDALRPTDTALAPLLEAGLDAADAVHALRAFVAFQTGSILRELGASPTFSGLSPKGVAARRADLASSGFVNIAAVADPLARCHHESEYAFGVELLISGVRAFLDQQETTGRQRLRERRPRGFADC